MPPAVSDPMATPAPAPSAQSVLGPVLPESVPPLLARPVDGPFADERDVGAVDRVHQRGRMLHLQTRDARIDDRVIVVVFRTFDRRALLQRQDHVTLEEERAAPV